MLRCGSLLAEVQVHSFWYYFVVTDINFPFFRGDIYICFRKPQQTQPTNADHKCRAEKDHSKTARPIVLVISFPFRRKKKDAERERESRIMSRLETRESSSQ
jgi:hypothetical protein